MKRILWAFLFLVFSANLASAQGLTLKNTQKIKIRLTGIDISGIAVSEPFPTNALVTFTLNQDNIADFVPEATTDPLGEVWFVPRTGAVGKYEIRASLVLNGTTLNATLPVTITRDYPVLSKVALAILGEPVDK